MVQKILLLEDVENVGLKGDVSSVKPGYAYNFLIPQGLALTANRSALRRQAKLQEERRIKAEADRKEALELAAKLDGEVLEIEVKVDHEGHLYGSVSALDIADTLKVKTGIEIEKRMIQMKHPIKEIGVFDLAVRCKEGVMAQIHVKVFSKTEE
jgi:large subunit ribosomal protein L9